MHELSIAQAVARLVVAEARRHGAAQVRTVGMRVGALTDLDPAAFQFAWAVLAAESPLLAGAALRIDRVPVTVRCRECGEEGPARPPGVLCGRCGSYRTQVLTGEELDVTEVELDVPDRGRAAEGASGKQPDGGRTAP